MRIVFFILLSCTNTLLVHPDRDGLLDLLFDQTLDQDQNQELFSWPLDTVEITSPFGPRGLQTHEGVDLKASIGTPVKSAKSGIVVYANKTIRGYGNMVVLRHKDRFFTVYAHHKKNLVKVGQKVSKGEVIALSGVSGEVSGPHLHFEIRQGTNALNPSDYIKKP